MSIAAQAEFETRRRLPPFLRWIPVAIMLTCAAAVLALTAQVWLADSLPAAPRLLPTDGLHVIRIGNTAVMACMWDDLLGLYQVSCPDRETADGVMQALQLELSDPVSAKRAMTSVPRRLVHWASVPLAAGYGAGNTYELLFPAWLLLPLLCAYPSVAFLCELDRRSRRSARGQCIACGCDLTAVHEPHCPQCGRGFDPDGHPGELRTHTR